MKPINAGALLAVSALLAACGQQDEHAASAVANRPEMPAAMGNRAMPAEAAKTASGIGTVTAIDKTAGTITLDHGPIAEAGWPAMTMAFKAQPALLDKVKTGDQVTFALKLEGGSGEVTAIDRQ
ncbi:copper-binding protein [Sphingomonas sp. MMSM20]|uniref:copper-binding protein n=1 Tax=Sphingomonas lycopersici TaxID=2951807 RepID=UPI002238AEBD|nr:copper-binding protein [Sphingomonas lycopersici]